MSLFLILAFLFFIGANLGWVLELFFRRFISKANPERKWINPGFCTGPYVPLYGFGLCILFLMASLEQNVSSVTLWWNKAILFALAAISLTVLEYIAGIGCLKLFKLRLWDYSDEWKNYKGIICPKYSVAWALLGAIYYFLIHPHIYDALNWLSENLAFSFVIGLFFGVFIIDVVNSARLVSKLKEFANDNDVVVRYEMIKVHIKNFNDKAHKKASFLRPFHSDHPLYEHLKEMLDNRKMWK